VAAAVICAAVFGIGGFFAVRSVFFNSSVPSADEIFGTKPAQELAVTEPPETLSETSSGLDILPELEQAIRDLETASAGMADSDAPAASPSIPPDPAAVPGVQPPAIRRGVLVLVIDDAGNNLQNLDPFLQFPGPITIAVLPGLNNSAETARRIRAAEKELFLHQPMEPLNGQDSGPTSIKTGMSPAEIRDIFVKNLNEIGPVTGFNNHEGSRATSDPSIMRALLEISRASGLCFLDSRTTAETTAPQIAKELGISIAERDIFLDNEQDRESILAALEAGCKRAEQNGMAVLIGHVWTPHLAAILTEMYPQLTRQGFVFASVSTILNRGK